MCPSTHGITSTTIGQRSTGWSPIGCELALFSVESHERLVACDLGRFLGIPRQIGDTKTKQLTGTHMQASPDLWLLPFGR
jgi:hypothetical protein